MDLGRDSQRILTALLSARLCTACVSERVKMGSAAALDVLARLSRVVELNEKPLRCEGCGRTTITYFAGDPR